MMEDEMLQYIAAGVTNGFENDESFGVDNTEVEKDFFDKVLAKNGYNEADIESLGYAEIVRLINTDEFPCCEGLKEHSPWCLNK